MKYLIVKTSSLGDIIQAFPVVEYIKQNDPLAEIDWIVEEPFIALVRAHPHIAAAIPIRTKKWRSRLFKIETWRQIDQTRRRIRSKIYDIVFDLQGNTKSACFTSMAKSSLKIGFGKNSVSEWPNLLATHRRLDPPLKKNIRADYLFLAQSYFSKPFDFSHTIKLTITNEESTIIQSLLQHPYLQNGPKVMVCPGAMWKNKQLSHQTMQDLLKLIQAQFKVCFIFIWGTQQEKAEALKFAQIFPSSSVVAERYSFPVLQNIMNEMDFILAMDSLPLHLAGTTKTPTFSCFGPSSAKKYRPPQNTHFSFQGSCPYGQSFSKRCPFLRTCPTADCLKKAQSQELFSIIEANFKKYF
ncbi:MAG: glycosyltransferase family 9 protein, partial [Parachlamydia sp.]|nr:glycosyltransferase family 9 protein [Parachlamydia sp.]